MNCKQGAATDEAVRRRQQAEDDALKPIIRADLERVLAAGGYEITHGCIMRDRAKGKLRAYPAIAVSLEHARRLAER